MYSEAVVTVTTAEQRETILGALTEAGNWLEEDGYHAETSVRIDIHVPTTDWGVFKLFISMSHEIESFYNIHYVYLW